MHRVILVVLINDSDGTERCLISSPMAESAMLDSMYCANIQIDRKTIM